MSTLNRILAGSLLLTLAACTGGGPDGGGGSTAATTLAYTDPTSGTYRLMRNAGLSTNGHLVLDLVGPAATNGRGVAFTLTADTSKVTWAKVQAADAALAQNVAFTLGGSPQIFKVNVSSGTLQAGMFQKGSGVAAVSLNTTLARVALDLNGGVAKGASVSLSAPASKSNLLPEVGSPQTITVTPGTLVAN